VVKNSDIIFTMLTNDEAVKDCLSENSFTGYLRKLFIDMSTISPEMTGEISSAVKIKEAGFIDAPVAGSTKPAAEGTLLIMAGGEEKDLKRAEPYLQNWEKPLNIWEKTEKELLRSFR
jgi:3-hydroxyisobutyrate dehydrogenase